MASLYKFLIPLDMSSNKISNLAAGTISTDATNLGQLTGLAAITPSGGTLVVTGAETVSGKLTVSGGARLAGTSTTPVVGYVLTATSTSGDVDWQPITGGSGGGFYRGNTTWTPGAVTTGTFVSTTVTVTGASLGDNAVPSWSAGLPAGVILSASVTSTNTTTVTLYNTSGSTQTVPLGTIAVDVFPGTGGVSGSGSISGTLGKIPKFTGATSVGDSIMADSGSAISIAGNLAVNGTSITSTNGVGLTLPAQIGIGSAVGANTAFGVFSNVSLASGQSAYGAYLNPTVNPAAAHSGIILGVAGGVTSPSGTVDAYNLYLSALTGSGAGAFGTAYGIYIESPTIATTKYALYTAGTAQSRFGGAATIVGKLTANGGGQFSGTTTTPVAGYILTAVDSSGNYDWQANTPVGGSVTTSGTPTVGYHTKFITSSTVGNSLVSESGSNVLVNGNLTFTDATYDIGASGATRARDLYLSRNIIIGGTINSTVANLQTSNSLGLVGGNTGINHFFTTGTVTSTGSNNVSSINIQDILVAATGQNAYGAYIASAIAPATSTTTNIAAQVYIPTYANTGAGIVTTAYGLFVAAPTAGATNNYAIYATGASVMQNLTLTGNLSMNGGVVNTTNSTGLQLPTPLGIGTTGVTNQLVTIGGSTSGSSAPIALLVGGSLIPSSNLSSSGLTVAVSVNTTSGALTNVYGAIINAPTRTGSVNTVTNAVALQVNADTYATNNYAARFVGSVTVSGPTTLTAAASADVALTVNGASAVSATSVLVATGVFGSMNVNQYGGIGLGVSNTAGAAQVAVGGTTVGSSNVFGVNITTTLTNINTGSSFGVVVQPTVNVGSGIIANYYGFYQGTVTKTGVGTISRGYGIYINKPTVAAANYSAYFEAGVGIGNAIPTDALDVTGNVGITGTLTVGNIIASTGSSAGIEWVDRAGGANPNWLWYASSGVTYLWNSTTSNTLGIDQNGHFTTVQAQQAISLSTGWSNANGGWTPAQYYKTPDGRVHLRGGVVFSTGGTTTIGTIPSGYYNPSYYTGPFTGARFNGTYYSFTFTFYIDNIGDIIFLNDGGAPSPVNGEIYWLDCSFDIR